MLVKPDEIPLAAQEEIQNDQERGCGWGCDKRSFCTTQQMKARRGGEERRGEERRGEDANY